MNCLLTKGPNGHRISPVDFPFLMLFTMSFSDLSDTHMEAAGATPARKRNAVHSALYFYLIFDKSVNTEALSPCMVLTPGGCRTCGKYVVCPQKLLIREMRLAYFKLLVLSNVEET